jgi:periplasmic divalent cation tolerance protein
MKEFRLVLTTVPDEETGRRIARRLVEERLAACVTISSGVTSLYRWRGEVVEDQEFVLLVKTKASLVARVESAIREIHPYEVPEIIALPIEAGSPDYLDWLDKETAD